MPVHSKIAEPTARMIIQDLLVGNKKRQLVSATILLIIGFLIHIRNKKPEVDSLRVSRLDQDKTQKKKVPFLLHRAARATSTEFSGSASKNW